MALFSSKKPIFRQARSFKSLDILLFVRIGHSPDRALFPPEVITPVVVSSLLSTLTWPFLLFLSPLFLPRTPTQTASVLKFFFPTTLPYNSLTSTPLLSDAPPSDSRTKIFSPDILPNSRDTFILGDFNAQHPTWDSLISPDPTGNDLLQWITSSGLEILNDPRLSHALPSFHWESFTPNIPLAPASFALQCEWRTLPGLGSDYLPIVIVLTLSPVCHPNTRPPNLTTKRPLGCLPIIYCWASPPFWCWRSQHPPGCPLLFPLLIPSS